MNAGAQKPPAPPFRLALSLPCSASGAAYTAGVLDFLTHALHSWELARARRENVPRWRVVLTDLAGASFGGVVASLFAAVVHFRHDALLSHFRQGGGGAPPNNALYDAWVLRFGPGLLLRDCGTKRCKGAEPADHTEETALIRRLPAEQTCMPSHHAHLFSPSFVRDLLTDTLPDGPVAPRPGWLDMPLSLTVTALNPVVPEPPKTPELVAACRGTPLSTVAREVSISCVTDTTGTPRARSTTSPARSAPRCSNRLDPPTKLRYDPHDPDLCAPLPRPQSFRATNQTDFVRLHFQCDMPTQCAREACVVPCNSVPVTPGTSEWGALLSAARATVAYPVAPGSVSGQGSQRCLSESATSKRHTLSNGCDSMYEQCDCCDTDDNDSWESFAPSGGFEPLSTAALLRELFDALTIRGAADRDGGTGAVVQIAPDRGAHDGYDDSDSETGYADDLDTAPLRVLQRSFCRVGGIVIDFRDEQPSAQGSVAGRQSRRNVSQTRRIDADTTKYAPEVQRFNLDPVRHGAGGNGLACDALGAFGGLLGAAVREHDFLLGRYDCQRFLRDTLTLDADTMRGRAAFRGLVPSRAKGAVPVVPLVGDAAVALTRPTWPVLRKRERRRVVADVGRLVERRVSEALDATERHEKVFLDGCRPSASAPRRYSDAVLRKAVRWRVLRACRRHVRSVLKDATAVFGS